jgi:urease accessory protein
MLVVHEILGDFGLARFEGRRVERLHVASTDAAKPRLRLTTDAGTDVAIQLERGSYLYDGAVVDDDGERIIAVERAAENTLVIALDPALDRTGTIEQALRIGHAFGNQHVPVELEQTEIRVPVLTSEDILLGTLAGLELHGAQISFQLMKLGRFRPLGTASHRHDGSE